MKIHHLLGSTVGAAATLTLANANEIDINEDISRARLQLQRGDTRTTYTRQSHPTRDLRAVPQTRASSTRASHEEETVMAKAAKKKSKSSKAGEAMTDDEEDIGSSKSAKSSSTHGKSDKMNSKSGKSSKDAYYIGPVGCPGHCVDVSGVNFMSGNLDNVLKPCDNDSKDQKWRIHSDDTFVKMESMTYPNMCIAIENKMNCSDVAANLILGDCDDHESMWYFTGGELISAYCWVNGFTNAMGAYPGVNSICDPGLFGIEGSLLTPVIRGDVFMFIDEEMIQTNEGLTTPFPSPFPSYFPTSSPTTQTGTPTASPAEGN